MKKISTWLLMLILLISCVGTAAAEDEGGLPFDVKPPLNVSVNWMEGNDSPTSMSFSFSIDPQITQALTAIEQARNAGLLETLLKPYGATDVYVNIQIDWALDDVNDPVSGWHYNKYWDDPYGIGFGKDEEYHCRYSEWDAVDWSLNSLDTVQDYWIMRGVPNDDRWNGIPEENTPGVKDQLRPDQYEYYDDSVHIDFTKHTAYFRVRFAFTAVMESEEGIKTVSKFSDWSETCGYGKDVAPYVAIKDGDIAAPEITDLHMTDKEFNDNPIVAFTLTVPDALAKMAAEAAAHGGRIVIDTEARVKGDAEWVAMGNTDWEIKTGEMECALVTLISENHPKIAKDTPIEIRCRYRCGQSGLDDIFSEYSKVLTFETAEIGNDPQPVPTEAPVVDEKKDEKKEEKKDKCPLCHFCPQPLGLCIFIWLLIILVIVAVIVVILVMKKKKDKENRQS